MKRTLLILALLGSASGVRALTITLDYSHDTFFSGNATAKAAMDAAAADLGAVILPSLSAVTTDLYSGTSGSTTFSLNWKLSYANPVTGVSVEIPTFAYAADTVTIYVGMRPITTAGTLGVGGPASAGFASSTSGFSAELAAAVAAGEAASNAAMRRSAGPIIGSLSGSTTLGATTVPFALDYGAMVGRASLDSDVDNDGIADFGAPLDAYWHYDHTTAVAAGKNDLYSVALHELVHALGVGSSKSFTDLHVGTTWTGANVIALTGTGVGALSPGGDHFAEGTLSTRVSDGVSQETAMDPSVTTGSRKFLTQLDLAFLRDIGYATIPEPSSGMLFFTAAAVLPARRRRRP